MQQQIAGFRVIQLLVPLLMGMSLPSANMWAQTIAMPASSGISDLASGAQLVQLPNLLARTDEDQQRVDDVKQLLSAPDPVDHLSRSLADIARTVDDELGVTAGGTLRNLPVMRLESLARHWEFDARRLDRWNVQARRAFTPYADIALQLAQRRAAWTATRAQSLANLPPVLAGRIDGILAQIDASEAALSPALTRQFELMRRASELRARIQSGADAATGAIDDIDRRLLKLDAPPLWQGLRLGLRTDSQSAPTAMHQGFEIERQFAIDYRAANPGNQGVLLMVQILLLPMILWLGMRARRTASELAERQPFTRALRRPISSWLMLCMLSVLVLEPDAPLLVQELALLVALVPVLRLLPTGTLSSVGVWPYVAITLYVVDRLGIAAVEDVELYRLFLLGLAALALALTVWLVHRLALAIKRRDNSLLRAVHAIGWAVIVLLAVAVMSNIAGNVSLAETLTSGVIDSGYMALLLYAAVAAGLGILGALLGQPELADRRLVLRHGAELQAGSKRLMVLAAALGWLLYSMGRFRVLRPLQSAGTELLGFGITVGEVSIHLGDILVFIFAVWLAFWAARAVRRVLRDELPNYGRLPRGAGNSIASLSYYGVLLLGLLVALSAAGFKVSQLALVFGALGVGIGFGLQNVVNNFVSGLVLMFERPIQPGDVVDAGGSSGTVHDIGLRATIIRTFEGAEIVVPNGLLLSGNLTNWTMFDRSRRLEAPITVGYGSDPAQVLQVLIHAARATPGVVEQPAPVALVTGYGDGALNFVVRAWTRDISTWADVRGDLLARVLAALEEAGICIPHKQVDLHLRTVPEEFKTFASGNASPKKEA
jgi:potassium-dependent mechanosensitive channel